MTNRITTVLVDVRVQALEIVIVNLFIAFHTFVQLVGVGPSTEESVAWVERLRCSDIGCQERSYVGIGLVLKYPVAFPDRTDQVAVLMEQIVLLLTKHEDVVHGPPEESVMRFVTLREAGRTPVPKTAVKFVDGLCVFIVSVDGLALARYGAEFTPIMGVLNLVTSEMRFPGQPFECHGRLIDASTTPTEQRFTGNGIGFQAVGT